MRYSKPTNVQEVVPYSTVKIDGCSEVKLGFSFLSEQPSISKRRYCNKVLVHECVSVPEISPIELDKVEFLATDDPCYKFFNLFKSSDVLGTVEPTIELQFDEYLVVGIIITFTKEETACLPLVMAYRINGYDPEGLKITLAQGNFCVTPCSGSDDFEPVTWVDGEW